LLKTIAVIEVAFPRLKHIWVFRLRNRRKSCENNVKTLEELAKAKFT